MGDNRLLDGLRVLDLSQYIPGPFATRQLADLGADVVKIEPPAGDPMRHFLYPDGPSPSPLYQELNRGKQILQLNLKEPDQRARFEELLEQADVLLESFRPGVMERLGFTRERLQELNPRLIHCALSGFGQDGPYRLRAGHDLTYCALAGILERPDGEPVLPFPPMADHAGAMQAVSAILAALVRRGVDGKGAFLDVSLCESLTSWNYLTLVQPPTSDGISLLSGGAACYNIYRTSDSRHVALAPLEEKFWIAFCEAVERSDWIERQWEPLPQKRLIGELANMFQSRPLEHWRSKLDAVDCCFEVIPEPASVADHPQHRARGLLGSGGQMSYPARIERQETMANPGPRAATMGDLPCQGS